MCLAIIPKISGEWAGAPRKRRFNGNPGVRLIDADIIRVPVGAGSLHVERYGRGGEPLVLLHGFGTCGFLWRNVAPQLAVAGHMVYSIDLLGYGESDRPSDADYGIAAQSGWVDAALAALHVATATVVGVDVGGTVAMHLAAMRPDRVKRLVPINALAFDEIPGRDIRAVQRSAAKNALQISRSVVGGAPVVSELIRGGFALGKSASDRLVARYLAPYVGSEGMNHLLHLARVIQEEDMEDVDLDTIQARTLVIRGVHDLWVKPDLSVRIARAIPGARITSLDGCARLVPEEAPDLLADLLLRFMRGE